MNNQILIQQPILTSEEINRCMKSGYCWDNSSFLQQTTVDINEGKIGEFEALKQGSGIDYSEIRQYQPGDDPRVINWRATARKGSTQVNIFHKEVTPDAFFLIDRRDTMRFGTRKRLKVTQAARIAVFLAAAEVSNNVDVGGVVINEGIQQLLAIGGQQGINQLAMLAGKACPPLSQQSTIDFKQALMSLRAVMSQQVSNSGRNVYLLSDFHDLNETMLSQLLLLSQQHKVYAIIIYDIVEKQLPDAGRLQLLWNWTSLLNKRNYINTNSSNVKKILNIRFEKKQQQIIQMFKKSGINYTFVCAHDDDIVGCLSKK